jgi:L-asparaginase / beta-aspartyl-peptidase
MRSSRSDSGFAVGVFRNNSLMLRPTCFSVAFTLLLSPTLFAQHSAKWAVAVHGGAGEAEWEHMDQQSADAYRSGLTRALAAATAKLQSGAAALDAVEAAINVLEDDPLFNAGRGAAFNAEGKNEMDASIMDGSTLAAGAVAGVQSAKNPISLARAVMEHTPHVMLIGAGADALAGRVGLPRMPPSYFFTESRWEEFAGVMKQSGRPIPPRPVPGPQSSVRAEIKPPAHKYGTVGVVARDVRGNIAAGTSTGGMQGKLPGRVGDSPIIGAATYAANQSCAVSSTGVGEYFIRLAVAKEICALVQYRGLSVQQAADHVIHKEVAALKGGEGGVIVLSTKEDPIWSFNTLGMFRARQVEGGHPTVVVEK